MSRLLHNIFFKSEIHPRFLHKKIIATLLLFLLLFISVSSFSNTKYSNVKIYLPTDRAQRLDLLALLEVDHLDEHNGAFNYTVDQKELALLKASGAKFEIIDDDAVAALDKVNQEFFKTLKDGKPTAASSRVAFERTGDSVENIIPTPTDFKIQSTLGGYYSWAQMMAAVDSVKKKYPSITDTFSIGQSVQGKKLLCLKISDNPTVDENEPEILFMGHHHAREAIGGASMIFLMQYLTEYYSKDSRIKDLVDNREIYIIVCVNPDGWDYNRILTPTGGAQHRKNMKNNSGNTTTDDDKGVDLNRNWGVDWANCTGAVGASNCGSSTVTADTYWGTAQYSEPETQALRTFCRSRYFGAIMDQHSVGPYYSLPWGRSFNTMNAADSAVYVQMASVMGKYNGMRYGSTVATLGYEVSGGMKDLLLRGDDSLPHGKCYGMTGEGSNGTSSTSFWPYASEITKLVKGMVYQDLQLMYTVGSYADIQDRGNINITPPTVAGKPSGYFHFRIRRIGLKSDTVKVSVVPVQNIYSVGSTVSIAPTSLPNFNSIYDDSISYNLSSSITSGNSVKFAWKIQTGGYTYYDTVVNIYKGTILASDNMEGSSATTNWTISSGWAYTNDRAFSGSKSFAESPGNASYADGVNLIAQYKTNLDLTSVGAAYLSFWVRYRAENFRDLLRVEVSTNGTAWVAIPGKNTVRQKGTADGSQINDTNSLTGLSVFWQREVFDLKNYIGNPALRIRFRFKSDPGGTTYIYDNDDGFNIDDFTITTGGTPSLLPLELTEFTGHNEGAVNVLNWRTATELNTKNFVIERSINGRDFEDIGTVNAAGNSRSNKDYSFTDTKPYIGENLYRLRMIDIDGSFKHSNMVSIRVNEETALKPTGIDKIYPNPTNGKIAVNFFVADEQATFEYKIFSNVGQIMSSDQIKLNKGENTITLDATDYAKGTYFITFDDLAKGISYENKFVKL